MIIIMIGVDKESPIKLCKMIKSRYCLVREQNKMIIEYHLSMQKKYENDPLVHDKISVSLFDAAMGAAKYSLIHASELNIPTLLLHGSEDLITSALGSKEFAGKSKMVELKVWDGGYHELHNEIFKEEVFKYIMNWIKR